MSEEAKELAVSTERDDAPASAVKEKPRKAPAPGKPGQLPPYKVLLHNDDVNHHDHVVQAIIKVTHLGPSEATARMREADRHGVSLLLVTHKERAELYKEQLETFSLTVTIEPDV